MERTPKKFWPRELFRLRPIHWTTGTRSRSFLLRNRAYKEGQWKAPTIISNAIGQGELLTTPIQLANFTVAIANRGYYYTPHLLNKLKATPCKNNSPKTLPVLPRNILKSLSTGCKK